jgi:hypothetical protein
MDTNEMRATVPAAGAPPTIEGVWAEVRQLSGKVDRLLRAVTKDPLDPEAKPGLVQRQEEHEGRLDDLDARVTKIENQGEEAAKKWGGRAWSTFYDIAKLAGAAGLGAWFGKGGPH